MATHVPACTGGSGGFLAGAPAIRDDQPMSRWANPAPSPDRPGCVVRLPSKLPLRARCWPAPAQRYFPSLPSRRVDLPTWPCDRSGPEWRVLAGILAAAQSYLAPNGRLRRAIAEYKRPPRSPRPCRSSVRQDAPMSSPSALWITNAQLPAIAFPYAREAIRRSMAASWRACPYVRRLEHPLQPLHPPRVDNSRTRGELTKIAPRVCGAKREGVSRPSTADVSAGARPTLASAQPRRASQSRLNTGRQASLLPPGRPLIARYLQTAIRFSAGRRQRCAETGFRVALGQPGAKTRTTWFRFCRPASRAQALTRRACFRPGS